MSAHIIEPHCLITVTMLAKVRFRLFSQWTENYFVGRENCFIGNRSDRKSVHNAVSDVWWCMSLLLADRSGISGPLLRG
jgi:hypothetical protein